MSFSFRILSALIAVPLLTLVWIPSAWSHGESGTALIGPEFAVQAEKHGVGFKLSVESIQFMGIKFASLEGGKIPASAWVSALEGVSLYVLRDGWIQRIDLEPSSRKSGTVPSGTFQAGDQLVVEGVAAVRGADLEISSSETEEEGEGEHEEGHDHDSHDESHEKEHS